VCSPAAILNIMTRKVPPKITRSGKTWDAINEDDHYRKGIGFCWTETLNSVLSLLAKLAKLGQAAPREGDGIDNGMVGQRDG
jgi:hypothetical protein